MVDAAGGRWDCTSVEPLVAVKETHAGIVRRNQLCMVYTCTAETNGILGWWTQKSARDSVPKHSEDVCCCAGCACREIVVRRPHEFKIACLQDIRALFPDEWNPFYAAFGNRDTDELAYR